jgi:acetoin utilization deacetylase AcuC-like enzyme
MSVGFVYDPIFLEHDTGDHPENPRRMLAAMALLESSGVLARLARIDAREATPAELALAHDARYVAAVERVARDGGGWADPDTLITPRSYDVAARAVGGTLAAVDAVIRGDVASAFCLVRPPGHHATPDQAMGFCIFNHVAVAAQYARTAHGLERVAIVDFDVHHGNGTQDVFYADPAVLYISTHEYPFYPGTGAAHETGTGDGLAADFGLGRLRRALRRRDRLPAAERRRLRRARIDDEGRRRRPLRRPHRGGAGGRLPSRRDALVRPPHDRDHGRRRRDAGSVGDGT